MASRKNYAPFRFPQFPPQELMQPRRLLFEQEIEEAMEAQAADRSARGKIIKALRAPIFRSIHPHKDDHAHAAREELRARFEERRKLRLVPPRGPKLDAGARLGSYGQPFSAPYDFSWTPTATTGNPSVASNADQNTGDMSFNISSDFNNSSSVDVWAGVGVYWSIPDWLDEASGTLTVTANASYVFSFDDGVVLDNAGTSGSLVLNVDSFDSAGGWQGLSISQGSQLYNDGSGGSNQGSNNSFSIQGQTQVDSDHFYNVWLFVHGHIFADGFHNLADLFVWDSWADGVLSATLNSLMLEFG